MRSSRQLLRIAALLVALTFPAALLSCSPGDSSSVVETSLPSIASSQTNYTVSIHSAEALLLNLLNEDKKNLADIELLYAKPIREGTLLIWREDTTCRVAVVDPNGKTVSDMALPETFTGTVVSVTKDDSDWVILSTKTDELFRTQVCVTRVAADLSAADAPVQLDALTNTTVYAFACIGDTLAVTTGTDVYFFDSANPFSLLGQITPKIPVYGLAAYNGKLFAVQDKENDTSDSSEEAQTISCTVLLSEVDLPSSRLVNTRTISSGEVYALKLFGFPDGFDRGIGVSMSDGFYLYNPEDSSMTKEFASSETKGTLSIQTITEIYHSSDGIYQAYGYYNTRMSESGPDRQFLMRISPSSETAKTPIRIAVLTSDSMPGIRTICNYVNTQDLPFSLDVTVYLDPGDPNFDISQVAPAKLAFLADALSDNPPDLLILSPEERQDFAAQGALLDLSPYIKRSETLDPETMLPNVWSAVTATQICDWIPPYITLTGTMLNEAYASELGQGDISDISTFLRTHPDVPFMCDASIRAFYPLLIDRIKSLPDGIGDSPADKQALVDLIRLMVDLRQQAKSQDDGAESPVAESVPSLSSLSNYISYLRSKPDAQVYRGVFGHLDQSLGISADGGLSVCAGTSHADLCWSVMETLLSENILDIYCDDIPLRQASFETMLLQSIASEKQNGAQIASGSYDGDTLIPVYDKPLDAEMISQFRRDVYSANGLTLMDTDLYRIVVDELTPCLEGDITPENCADHLISRVGLYQSEKDYPAG